MPMVESREQVELKLLNRHAGGAALQIRDGLSARQDARALVAGRKKIRGPRLSSRIRQERSQHDKRRQIAVLGAEAVADPGAKAGSLDGEGTGVDSERGLEMLKVTAGQRTDDAEIIDAAGDVRK